MSLASAEASLPEDHDKCCTPHKAWRRIFSLNRFYTKTVIGIFGTRPEAIKMTPVLKELDRKK